MIDLDEKQIYIERDAMLLANMLHQLRLFNQIIDIDNLKDAEKSLRDLISHAEAVGFIFGDRGYKAGVGKHNLKVLSALIALLEALGEQEEETHKLLDKEKQFKDMQEALNSVFG